MFWLTVSLNTKKSHHNRLFNAIELYLNSNQLSQLLTLVIQYNLHLTA